MRGNLSGKQELKYAENENPAYEAPNGSQSAHNYQPRFIGAKRSKDGLKYFAVRTKQTAVLNSKTRSQMGLLGCIAAIKSAVMALPATGLGLIPWKHIEKCAAAYKEANPTAADAKSVNTYFDARVRRLLRYKQASYTFTETGVSGGWVLENPFQLENETALEIAQAVWDKFAPLMAFGTGTVVVFSIDGKAFINPAVDSSWQALKAQDKCPNLETQWTPITIVSEKVKYNSLAVYNESGVEQTELAEPGTGVYSTLDPTA